VQGYQLARDGLPLAGHRLHLLGDFIAPGVAVLLERGNQLDLRTIGGELAHPRLVTRLVQLLVVLDDVRALRLGLPLRTCLLRSLRVRPLRGLSGLLQLDQVFPRLLAGSLRGIERRRSVADRRVGDLLVGRQVLDGDGHSSTPPVRSSR